MDDTGAFVVFVVFWLIIGAVVGGLIGAKHNQAGSGIVWGALLGPIGWIITFALPDERPKCPECLGAIPEGARRCQHCGFVFLSFDELLKRLGEAEIQNPIPSPSAPISDRSLALRDKIATLEAEIKNLDSQLQRAPAPSVAPSIDVETESKTEVVQSKASTQLDSLWVTCNCNVCSGTLEFEAVHAGTTVQCPHCGMETVLFAPIERVSEPPTKPPRRRLNFSWKRIAIVFIALFAIVAFITYQSKKGEQKEMKKMEDIVNPTPPTWDTLQTNALKKILEDCSNNVVGLQRIVKSSVDEHGTPSNWTGTVTIEFINKAGGIERKDRWYFFDTIPNSTGKIMDVIAYEDIERWGADELGNADDQYKMGIRYLEGYHAWTDVDMAKMYFQKAAVQGNKDAVAELAKMPRN